ncbi:hypothetical protein GR78_22805 [Salmonella enterica]|nr:hypothetical protein [Salmonella enterica]
MARLRDNGKTQNAQWPDSAGAPVILTALAIIVIGVMIAWCLNEIDSDDNLNLSNILKNAIRRGSIAHA